MTRLETHACESLRGPQEAPPTRVLRGAERNELWKCPAEPALKTDRMRREGGPSGWGAASTCPRRASTGGGWGCTQPASCRRHPELTGLQEPASVPGSPASAAPPCTLAATHQPGRAAGTCSSAGRRLLCGAGSWSRGPEGHVHVSACSSDSGLQTPHAFTFIRVSSVFPARA